MNRCEKCQSTFDDKLSTFDGYNTRLEFRFNLPEDRVEFDMLVKHRDFYCALHDVDKALRNLIRRDDDVDGATSDKLQEIRNLIPDIE